jgi:phosphogluconate dehydratase
LGGPIGRVRTGDLIALDGEAGRLEVKVDRAAFMARPLARQPATQANVFGYGRDLFGLFRQTAAPANRGGGVFGPRVASAHETERQDDVQWSADHV